MSFQFTPRKLFLPAVFIAALAVLLLQPSSQNLTDIANKIQNQISETEDVYTKNISNEDVWNALEKNDISSPSLELFRKKNLRLYFYRNDSLQCWTSSEVIPVDLPSATSASTLLHLKNGWYYFLKSAKEGKTITALLPVKHSYISENKFLQNNFAFDFSIPQNTELSSEELPNSVAVKNGEGKLLFSLFFSDKEKGESVNYLLLIAQSVMLLLLLYSLTAFSLHMVRQNKFVLPLTLLTGGFILLCAALRIFNSYTEFSKLELFQPKLYATSLPLFRAEHFSISVSILSLGDLLLYVILFCVLVIFYNRFKNADQTPKNKLTVFIAIVKYFFCTAAVTWIFKTLVMDSVISFEVYNVLSLSFYSVLGMFCLGVMLLAHFLITKNVVEYFRASGVSLLLLFAYASLCAGVYLSFASQSPFYHIILFSGIWAFCFLFLMVWNEKQNTGLSLRQLIIYVSFYSLLTTFFVENLYERRERNQREFFSGKLVTERDFVAEYAFNDIAQRIANDEFIRNFFSSPLVSKNEISSRISELYLGGYFNKYELKLYAFDAQDNCLKNQDSCDVSFLKEYINRDSASGSLHYISDTSKNYSYLSVIDFKNDSAAFGKLVLRLNPKIYYGQNVYPELLLGDNVVNYNSIYNYGYAVYQNDKLVAQSRDFPYPYNWNKDYIFDEGDFSFVEEPDWEHSIQRFTNGKKVIVTVAREPVFEPVATFSYLFTFFFAGIVVVMFLQNLRSGNSTADEKFSLSFRSRINYSMMLMILVSFVIIGFVTIGFFRKQYDNFYNDRLLRKEKVVHASLEFFIQQKESESDLKTALGYEVARLAGINSVDIDLFDRAGTLAVSSQQLIYDKGLVSKKMNPEAYFKLLETKGVQETYAENIGALHYLATYSSLRNKHGDVVAYLGIPYFERTKDVNAEVSSFLVALMNVYVFILIIAAFIAYFISNSITRPLTIISGKLRFLNLNKKNEPIEWRSNDEIGVLISEYNKMITELEQSAQKLAKSERESAWREMAKQIAHEIKNPLTPMKLSIQYLQRAIDEGNPNVSELAKKVTKTLNEQIENLSGIATAFSSFAKMPKAENEIVNLNELVKSICDLFNRQGEAQVSFSSSANDAFVFADKNQLVSVFNNLVKNAIQSIPEFRQGFVEVTIIEEGRWLIVAVKDNGEGILVENYDKVFVPNFTTKSSGTGLGLAICKQIIDGAGGRIWFEPNENEGTAFKVQLKKNENISGK